MKLKIIAVGILIGLVANPLFAKNDNHKHEKKHQYDKHDNNGKYEEKHKSGKYRSLNKGMEKRLDSGKELPKGWQKKLIRGNILDREVYEHSRIVRGVDLNGQMTIEVDNRLIRLHQATMEIIDVLK
jgi:hypothetical protein